jgi:hypothetical protein
MDKPALFLIDREYQVVKKTIEISFFREYIISVKEFKINNIPYLLIKNKHNLTIYDI